jgi:hypothetical protein
VAGASILVVRNTPLPDTTQAVRVSKGSNSTPEAQWIELPVIQSAPFGLMANGRSMTLDQVRPPSREVKTWSPQPPALPCGRQ